MVQLTTLSLPTRVEVELGCDKKPAGMPTGGIGRGFQSKEFIDDGETAAEAIIGSCD